MANTEQSSDEKYEGPSKTIETLGKGNAVGWAGSIIGAIVGAVVGMVSSSHADAITKWFKNLKISNTTEKTAIVIGSALVFSQIGHWISYAIGLRHGHKHAGKGQKQFERIKQERDAAKQELEAVKSELDATAQEHHAKDDAGTLDRAEMPSSHIHAGVVEAGKDAAAEIAR
jgi:hypothetical protein